MFRSTRRTLAAVSVIALTGAALVVPAAASAKQVSVKIHSASGTISGTTLASKLSGTLGNGTMKGKLVIPKTQQVWTFKGGTIKVTGTGTTGAADDAAGTWKVTGGTGKFKGASGGGKFSGKQSTGVFDYTGKITY